MRYSRAPRIRRSGPASTVTGVGNRIGTAPVTEGPFKKFTGYWNFIPLREDACKIEFALHYEFSNIILEKLIGPVLSHIANTFVESFVKRASERYSKG
ncbi:SRPBCC family protein [Paraburkholderia sp. CI3]|uniref:SRPBCC family protein n=1 Tax=Paraburkholderia sp. CI3 TaxID=2991060 RepID=UPI003D1925CB